MANQQNKVKIKQAMGPGCVRRPSQGQQELVRLSEKVRVVEAHVQTSPGGVQILAGQTRPFCAYYFGSDKEGIVTGVSFYEPTGDYLATPVFFGKAGNDQLTALFTGKIPAASNLKTEVIDTYNVTFGPRGNLMRFADERGYYFERGRGPCLSMKNTTGVTVTVEGYMTLLCWAEEDRAQALEEIGLFQEDSAPFGGEKLFQ